MDIAIMIMEPTFGLDLDLCRPITKLMGIWTPQTGADEQHDDPVNSTRSRPRRVTVISQPDFHNVGLDLLN